MQYADEEGVKKPSLEAIVILFDVAFRYTTFSGRVWFLRNFHGTGGWDSRVWEPLTGFLSRPATGQNRG